MTECLLVSNKSSTFATLLKKKRVVSRVAKWGRL